jgi:hypothetical protein
MYSTPPGTQDIPQKLPNRGWLFEPNKKWALKVARSIDKFSDLRHGELRQRHKGGPRLTHISNTFENTLFDVVPGKAGAKCRA